MSHFFSPIRGTCEAVARRTNYSAHPLVFHTIPSSDQRRSTHFIFSSFELSCGQAHGYNKLATSSNCVATTDSPWK